MPTIINNGWEEVDYLLTDNYQLNQKLSDIINSACHVFYHHPDGDWREKYKPKYSAQLAELIKHRQSLIRKLLGIGDRVITMITYEAIELLKSDA